MKEYTLGFLINDQKSPKVWLIRKNKPEWQKGKLNGIGGKIEKTDMSPYQAQVREFKEEAGLDIPNWEHFCTITDDNAYAVYCFRAFSTETPTSMTDEKLEEYYIDSLPSDTLFNIPWLVAMAHTYDSKQVELYKVKEIMA
jgi:8-oxo-dGTP diphosphatase